MKLYYYMLTALLVVVAQADCLQAQIPRTLSYQGVLTDAAGKPRPDDNYTLIFRLYNVASGGTAIWSESKTLFVKGGLFSTTLGDQTPFGANVKFDRQYWLGIQVGNESELAPRIALTSVGYSMNSLRADTAKVAVASLADSTWKHDGTNIFRLNGNVGVGTETPESKLHILNVASENTMKIEIGGGYGALVENTNPGYGGYAKLAWIKSINQNPFSYHLYVEGAQKPELVVLGNGNVGVGTETPESKLHILNVASENAMKIEIGGGYGALVENTNPGYGGYAKLAWIKSINQNPFSYHLYIEGAQKPELVVTGNGDIGIGTSSPTTKLDVAGRTKTCVLEITGGCDLAEPFPTSEAESLPLGAIVVIDEDTPGHLKLSRKAYDKGVAGIVSGAGGINPGLTLRQEGLMEGEQNIALSGRVYALATAANGPIKPGDLLTTSNLPGHAMKATDHDLANGAVIGKAMSRLEQEEGLVLVLVNLQ